MLANEQAIKHGEVPPLTEAISAGVRWRPEPFKDGEHFDLAEVVTGRGWGDCDDLAPWLAGELRATGEDPGARPRVYQSGPGRWHVVTETSDGEILDPSKWAGMDRYKRTHGGVSGGIVGMIARPFARPHDGALAVMPRGGQFWARCDIPIPGTQAHLASHARSNNPEQSISRAIAGAIDCGRGIGGVDVERLSLAGTVLLGDSDDLVSVGFLPALAALAPAGISLAKGLFSKGKKSAPPAGAQTHPGGAVSVPIERPRKDNSQHMTLTYHPVHSPGPVVMRF